MNADAWSAAEGGGPDPLRAAPSLAPQSPGDALPAPRPEVATPPGTVFYEYTPLGLVPIDPHAPVRPRPAAWTEPPAPGAAPEPAEPTVGEESGFRFMRLERDDEGGAWL